MVKIKVSYEERQELEKVIKLLSPVIVSYKISKNDKGQFKKAYIEIK